jgi:hypothetical protein
MKVKKKKFAKRTFVAAFIAVIFITGVALPNVLGTIESGKTG